VALHDGLGHLDGLRHLLHVRAWCLDLLGGVAHLHGGGLHILRLGECLRLVDGSLLGVHLRAGVLLHATDGAVHGRHVATGHAAVRAVEGAVLGARVHCASG